MPLYTYKCEKCRKKVTDLLPLRLMNKPPKCKCGGKRVRFLKNDNVVHPKTIQLVG